MSSVAVTGYKRFIVKCQEISEMETHPTLMRTDGGAEWKGSFATYLREQRAAQPDAYAHSLTTGGRASGNSIAERSVASIRRLQYAHYRSVVRKWDDDKVATRHRRYDMVEHLDMTLERYNGKLHSTIKCTPIIALMPSPSTYAEVKKRIIRAAVRIYGARNVDREQPAFSSEGALEKTALVRKSIWESGQPGKVSRVDSKNKRWD